MDRAENSSGKHSLFLWAALLAPVTQAASVARWTGVAAMAMGAWLLGRWCRYGSGWVLVVQRIWGCVLISVLMGWSTFFWEGQAYQPAVPYVLLILAAWTVAVPGKAQRIGCVLLWPLMLLLGAVLLSGLREVKPSYLIPQWEVPDLSLFAILLLPSLVPKRQGRWKSCIAAILVSVITAGVLSPKVSTASLSGIYELSRSLSLLGMAERFESLIAAAMTLGFFLAMAHLLESPEGEKGLSTWLYPAVAAGFYLLGPIENGLFLAVGSVLFWVVLPWLPLGKIFSKNGKKGIDKKPSAW